MLCCFVQPFFSLISFLLLNGSLGCLMFAIIGRQLLALILDQEKELQIQDWLMKLLIKILLHQQLMQKLYSCPILINTMSFYR